MILIKCDNRTKGTDCENNTWPPIGINEDMQHACPPGWEIQITRLGYDIPSKVKHFCPLHTTNPTTSEKLKQMVADLKEPVKH